jgi:hypothetical protein
MDKDADARWTAKQLLEHPFLANAESCKKEFADVIRNFETVKAKSLF